MFGSMKFSVCMLKLVKYFELHNANLRNQIVPNLIMRLYLYENELLQTMFAGKIHFDQYLL